VKRPASVELHHVWSMESFVMWLIAQVWRSCECW